MRGAQRSRAMTDASAGSPAKLVFAASTRISAVDAWTWIFPHSGTFSANPITMTAGLTAMKLFDRDEVERLNALGDRTRKQIAEAIRTA